MNKPGSPDKRHFTRITFESRIQLSNSDGIWNSELVDISLNGVLIEKPAGWSANVGDEFLVKLDLHESDIEIRMEAEVAHIESNRVGLHCKHIDLDSVTHLRRLVELNLGSTEVLYRELSALGG
jgi:hypothetical protein